MGRLIDCDKLCSDLLDRWSIADKEKDNTIRSLMADVVTPIVASQPTVDAIEVVRCRDCKWRDNQKGATKWMPCRALVTPNDFYCPRGERKDGGNNGQTE